jgi:hypothetical protein
VVRLPPETSAGTTPFHVEIVGERVGPLALASGVSIEVHRAIDTFASRWRRMVMAITGRERGAQPAVKNDRRLSDFARHNCQFYSRR